MEENKAYTLHISMDFSAYIHGPEMMNPTVFGDPGCFFFFKPIIWFPPQIECGSIHCLLKPPGQNVYGQITMNSAEHVHAPHRINLYIFSPWK